MRLPGRSVGAAKEGESSAANMTSTVKSSPYKGVTLFKPTMKWRAQISANGKTTSLGDYDTEEQAAIAFDRASISKVGRNAKTNFPLDNYADEISQLEGMDLNDLVAMLRSKAKKHGAQTSHFRGVSLLKQTKKWHAQINVGGKQVHLGFFPTEEFAARAYDRAAINKGAQENTVRIVTNFELAEYADELDFLRQTPQQELIDALASESKRRQQVLPPTAASPANQLTNAKSRDATANEDLFKKAEKAHPKATLRNRLYEDFGKKREDALGREVAARDTGNAPDLATSTSAPSQPTDLAQAAAVGVERQLDIMFLDALLPSVRQNPELSLPLVDPLTGAPAAVVAKHGFRFVDPGEVNTRAFASVTPFTTTAPATPKRSRESAKPITKSKAQSPVSNVTARQSALQEAELTTPAPGPQPAPQSASRQSDSHPPEVAAEEPVAKARVDLDFNLASPVKKRRSNLTHKPATPERLRKFASLPHMPFTPERLPQRKRPRPTEAVDVKLDGRLGKASRHLSYGSLDAGPQRKPPASPMKPLTKRQQAIAERNQAAAILTSCSRSLEPQTPPDDAEEDPLMHFANVALSELAAFTPNGHEARLESGRPDRWDSSRRRDESQLADSTASETTVSCDVEQGVAMLRDLQAGTSRPALQH